ncbi:DNA polymerase III subunit delta [candidate division WOR-3 bacterium JGI_Cruoil_03_51_56]|uniref:DNA polymerase III subunit delta n=1 Tax=candidate division WOR-3 bacterium JGI_Cruoil_03_51_56 TaxID=1973747 RepID=A0A235BN01_UNCW3|nr:MAG: DNA polymerase III subunit delta [candidate division WOR-3 bacterium JGI_Cruoil_03_51_56]
MWQSKGKSGRLVLASVNKGRFEPVYILLGEDSILVDEIINRLKKRVISPAFEPFDFDLFQADEIIVERMQEQFRQPPVGSERRLVVIKGITRQGKKGPIYTSLQKNGTAKLLEMLVKVPETTTVVVTGIEKPEFTRLISKTGLTRFLVEVGQPKESGLASLIQQWAKEQGISLTPDAGHLLIEIAGQNTATLKGEVEKLATCFDKGEVSVDAVRELAGASRVFHLKEYVDKVLMRDVTGALEILCRLEDWGEAVPKIVAWLTNGFLDLAAAKAGVLSRYARQRIESATEKWRNSHEVNQCLQQLYELDRAFVSGKPEPFARLEVFTHCIGCGSSEDYCGLYLDDKKWDLCMRSRLRRKNERT